MNFRGFRFKIESRDKNVGPLLALRLSQGLELVETAKRRRIKASRSTLVATAPTRQRASTRPTKKWQFCRLGALFALLAFSSCRPNSETKPELTLYAAASLTDVVEALATAFDLQDAYQIHYNFAGSGALAKQLIAAPKADLFLSANPQWMHALVEAGRISSTDPRSFLSNRLCLIAHPNADFKLESPAQLSALDFQYLALGDPTYVPSGVYAQQWLSSVSDEVGTSLWQQVKNQLLPTTDVRAVIGAVAASAKVIGIVYQTDYLAAQSRVQLLHSIPEAEAPPINYQATALNTRAVNQDFLEFLNSETAHAIFESHGFISPTR